MRQHRNRARPNRTSEGTATRAGLLDPADVAIGLLGAAVLVPIELWALSPAPLGARAVAMALLGTMGLVVGLVIASVERVVRLLPGRAWLRAGIRALPTTIATVPLARTLFEGAFASTLPGASTAFIWLPMVGVIATAVTLRVGEPLAARARARRFLGVALIAVAVGFELANRTVQRAEYPDVHTFLLVGTCVIAGLALRMLVRGLESRLFARGVWVVSAAIALGFPAALAWGLASTEARWAVANHGMHTRMLVRLTRGVFDRDGDGYSPYLGGGDCDDDDPTIHPGAREIPGNAIDENCDGFDGDAAATEDLARAREEHARALDAWRSDAALAALLERTRGMDVVLIMVDALRADALADTPRQRAAYPALFALLDESRWFMHAFAPSSGTDLSLSGLFTGRINPWTHPEATLPEAMHASGRTTHGVIPSEVLRYVGKSLLTRGLDGHDRLVNDRFERDVGSYTTSHRTTDFGAAFLERVADSDTPFFLWLHYFDVHEHHEVKARDRRLRARGIDLDALAPEERYALMVSLVDEEVARVRELLEQHDRWNRTIVVLVSDHGESLGEDPRLPDNHGRYVYNALVHVPVAIRIPDVPPRKVQHAISLLDLYPTLIELIGGTPPASDGTTLLPHLVGDVPHPIAAQPRPIALNESDQYGVIVWPEKLMVRRNDNLIELYDLAQDFGERNDLSSRRPERVRALMGVAGALPTVEIDRTRKGRRAREHAAQPEP